AEHQRFAGAPFEVELPRDRWLRVVERRRADGLAYSTHIDITEMKRLQLEISRARDEAEQANAAKSHFLPTMSHEIRTPLAGVLGFADLLLHTDLTATQRRYVELQRDAGKSLLTVLNDILDFSKLEAGEMAIAPEQVELGALFDSLGQFFRQL